IPRMNEIVQRTELGRDCLSGERPVAFSDQPAVAADIFDALGNDAGRDAGNDDLGGSGGILIIIIIVPLIGVIWIRWDWIVIVIGLVNNNRRSIEGIIPEQLRRLFEIHDREIVFVIVFINSSATSNDLLKHGHGGDCAVENN